MGCSWFSCHKFGRKPSEVDGEIAAIDNVKIYKYREIRQATDDFSAANKIGEGGFGYVYKGRLKDGKIAAIKVLSVCMETSSHNHPEETERAEEHKL